MIPAGQDFAPCRTGRGLAASRRPFGDARSPVRHGAAGAEESPLDQVTQLNNEVSTLSGDLTTRRRGALSLRNFSAIARPLYLSSDGFSRFVISWHGESRCGTSSAPLCLRGLEEK